MGGVGGVLNTHENLKCRLFKFKLCMVFKKGGNPSANCLNSKKKTYKTKGSKYTFGYYKFKTGQR